MKKAVTKLAPYIEEESKDTEIKTAGKILLATVRGDVHDIGKNIVAVVLGCSNYEVIDLGVMVPSEKIIDTAVREKVDFIGLSGLITPSLEEMVHVASEMERRKLDIPLLIGGATTSEVHAAVKIAPEYSKPVIHVRDASKAAGVLSSLMKNDNAGYTVSVRNKYNKLYQDHQTRRTNIKLLSIEEARHNRLVTEWDKITIHCPEKPGLISEELSVEEVLDYIDWTYFFYAWKITGRYPEIFNDPVRGEEARKLYDDAHVYLKKIINDRLIIIKAVSGLFPAVSVGDDVKVLSDSGDTKAVFRFLRNQEQKERGGPNLSLADFIAPEGSGLTDYIGAFVVTARPDDKAVESYRDDDYSSLMIKLIADRLAEAATEFLHLKIRKSYWAYVPGEDLTTDELFRVKYTGIRPAPGYPACPDHTEKKIIFDLLDAEKKVGVGLTESYAMTPVSSVCGYIFSHPHSAYFNVGKIGNDQLQDYAKRKGITTEEAGKWLAPNLK